MKEKISTEPLEGYRPCVGLFLLNGSGKVFVGNRINMPGDAWQFPQGGIDDGETVEQAAMRELHEELGTVRARLLESSRCWRSYDLPPEVAARRWRGRFLGQTQKWVALAFEGDDGDIVLDAHEPEFREWQWMDPQATIELAVWFKRPIYASVVDEFRHLWA